MKSYNSLDNFKSDFKTIVTIGTFDGVHIGHRYIINYLNKIAKREGGQSVLLTFSPHPRLVINKEHSHLKLIDTLDEKKEKLKNLGLQNFVVQKFTKEFSRIKYVNFVRDILVKKLNVDHLVIGYDHQFGRNREGSIKELQELSQLYDFKVEEIPPQKQEDVSISSTKIRNLVLEGNIETVNKYLANNFLISGKVIDGEKIGRTINYPTANISFDKDKLIPKAGVYAVSINVLNKSFDGMLNIGVKQQKIEVHIFDFSKNIYGLDVKIEFKKLIRENIKFANISQLKNQLVKDEKKCREFFY
ncbi:bifunctional riboflavin kinase/FAD synthetase [Flavobacteriales bacterium]|nr:bifunctional riboflavin kinase/FAD synthetase [Flavobacteriales bacterium]MDC1062848.1 bifunctional riboflavin kinase/FAD synthetase [Flavobacteriales bacterium]